MALQHLRSSTANKRPTPAGMSDGQLALNTNDASPGLFFKDSNGALVKVGPVHVGTTAPNATPGSGGSSGNSIGEQWLDTTGGTYVFKTWDGSAWRSESGTFVDVNGDVMTGALGIIAGSAGSPGLYFSGDTNTGLYSPGADQVAISTAGSERLRVNSGGLMGLATSNPQTLLSLLGGYQIGWNHATDGTKYAEIYADTSSNLIFRNTNSQVERMRLDSSGRLGIGTSAPSKKFEVANGDVRLSDGYTISWGDDAWRIFRNGSQLRFDTNGSQALTIDSSQRVGIGNTGPQAIFHSKAGATTSAGIFESTSASGSFLSFVDTGTSSYTRVQVGSVGNELVLRTTDQERCRVDSSGRLLVGTSSSPSFGGGQYSRLIVQGYVGGTAGEGDFSIQRGETASTITSGERIGVLRFNDSDGYQFANIECYADATAGAGDYPGRLVFSTTADGASSPTERMRITNSGSVFIGTQSALNNEIHSFAGSQGNGGDGVLHVRNTLASSADASPCLVLSKTATTTTSSARFIQFYANNATQAMGGIVGNGATNIQFASISDIRDKENINELTGCLDKVKQLEVVSYDWKDNKGHVEAGFIAQNVETVFPEYVVENMSEDNAEPRKGITGGMSSGYVAVLTAALQEAIAKIETLEARLSALEAQ